MQIRSPSLVANASFEANPALRTHWSKIRSSEAVSESNSRRNAFGFVEARCTHETLELEHVIDSILEAVAPPFDARRSYREFGVSASEAVLLDRHGRTL